MLRLHSLYGKLLSTWQFSNGLVRANLGKMVCDHRHASLGSTGLSPLALPLTPGFMGTKENKYMKTKEQKQSQSVSSEEESFVERL